MSDRASAVRLVATSSSTSVLPRLRCRPRRPIPCLEEGTTSYSSSAKSSSYSSASSRPSTYFMSSSSSAASSAASAASSSSSSAASSAASADSSQLAPVTLLRFDPPNGPCGARNREKETFFRASFFSLLSDAAAVWRLFCRRWDGPATLQHPRRPFTITSRPRYVIGIRTRGRPEAAPASPTLGPPLDFKTLTWATCAGRRPRHPRAPLGSRTGR